MVLLKKGEYITMDADAAFKLFAHSGLPVRALAAGEAPSGLSNTHEHVSMQCEFQLGMSHEAVEERMLVADQTLFQMGLVRPKSHTWHC